MRREHVGRRCPLARLGEGEPLFGDELADVLQQHERRVALVDVPDGRTVAEAFQGAQPADAQNDLLQDARLVVSSVEARGDLAVLGAVLRNVRVQEKQRNPSDLD